MLNYKMNDQKLLFIINLVEKKPVENKVVSIKFSFLNMVEDILKNKYQTINESQRLQLVRLQSYINSHLDEF